MEIPKSATFKKNQLEDYTEIENLCHPQKNSVSSPKNFLKKYILIVKKQQNF